MRVEFDTKAVRELIEVWKRNADLHTPMSDELKIIMMAGRRKLLDTHLDVAAVLKQVLAQMTPVDNVEELELTEAAVGEFYTWAQNGLIEIERLSRFE